MACRILQPGTDSLVSLLTVQVAGVGGTMSIVMLLGLAKACRHPKIWHGTSFITLAIISFTTCAYITSPISNYRKETETLLSAIVASSLFLMVGVLILAENPLTGTMDNPANRNVQLAFALAVSLVRTPILGFGFSLCNHQL